MVTVEPLIESTNPECLAECAGSHLWDGTGMPPQAPGRAGHETSGSSAAAKTASSLLVAPSLGVLADGATVRFVADEAGGAAQRFNHEASNVQSAGALRHFGSDVKYFEVTIISFNPRGTITVGLGHAPLHGKVGKRRPGLAPRSLGLSSDGLLFAGSPGQSQRYGQTWGTGDTIGCGYDSNSRDVFFTINGCRMPSLACLKRVSEAEAHKAHPTVSLSSPHDAVLLNFSGNFK